ncbi:MAG: NADH:quinone oxidoreductase, partial [Paracoccaceae bacterium]
MSSETSNGGKIITLGAIATVIAYLVLKVLVGYELWPALLLALLIGALVAILIWIGFYRDAEDDEFDVSPELKSAPDPGPAPEATKPVSKPAVAKKSAEAAAVTTKPAKKPAAKKPAKKPAAKAKPATPKTPTKAKPVAPDGKPATLSKARAGGADDLKLIGGLGPALEKTLNDLGIFHFDQVAGWRKAEIAWVDARLRFKGRIERDGWTKQAKALAKSAK